MLEINLRACNKWSKRERLILLLWASQELREILL